MLKVALVGFGNMGQHHYRVLRMRKDVEVVGIVDPRAHSLQHAVDVQVMARIEDLSRVDAAVIASPTTTHKPIAERLIREGVHVLIEKPLASNAEEAQQLVQLAQQSRVVLAVGHIERFNPAVEMLREMVSEPLLLQFERLSPYSPRIPDSVVMDLMIHDLDLVYWLGGRPADVFAVGASVVSDKLDVALAGIKLDGGGIATVQSSRVTEDKVRRIAVSERGRYILVDAVRQDIAVKKQTTVSFETEGRHAFRQTSVVEIPYLDRAGEPLAREIDDFLRAIHDGTHPRCTGEDGLRAVELARRVEQIASRS